MYLIFSNIRSILKIVLFFCLFVVDRHLELVECTEDEALSYCVQLLVNSLKVKIFPFAFVNSHRGGGGGG